MRAPLTYYGGKQRLAKRIVSMIPPHKMYVEPFFGGGAVFFKKNPSKVEVINDINDRIITFYQAIQGDHEALFTAIKNTPHSETLHKLAREIYNQRTDYDQVGMAWAVWHMTNAAFTGSPHGSWRWCNGNSGSHVGRVLERKRNLLSEALYRRIRYTQISCRDGLSVIEARDSKDAFFYLDPPYPGANQKHYGGYSFEDFRKLLDILAAIQGKFILSNYWSQTLRYYVEKYNWHTDSIKSLMTISNLRRTDAPMEKTEYLISNFKPSREYQTQFNHSI